jgi:hypothetical protein
MNPILDGTNMAYNAHIVGYKLSGGKSITYPDIALAAAQ